ncbi:MAG: response regulator, partial [Elusimicrobia bacterium]|nr:response regulator [Elusimicrobiota bacterium]
VLIVDDDPAVGAAIRSALARAADPYEVAAVADPVRGLVEIGRCPPDLLVLDLLLPVVDGYEICRILKASPFTQGIRILAITGGSPSRAQAAFLAEHADALLAKPFDPRKLTAAVRKLLD